MQYTGGSINFEEGFPVPLKLYIRIKRSQPAVKSCDSSFEPKFLPVERSPNMLQYNIE